MVSKSKVVKSKIVCTIGPASSSEKVLKGMVEAGMDVARINFSHGTHEEHARTIERIRSVDDGVAVMCDIQGPRIRVGRMSEPASLERGKTVVITTEDVVGDEGRVPIPYKGLTRDLKKGDRIFIGDGIIMLEVLEVKGREVRCRVLSGGVLTSNKGVNLPRVKLSVSVPTEKDRRDLEFIAGLGPEYVAVSFVGNKGEVKKVRAILDDNGGSEIRLISKIERQAAIESFDGILQVSDGIMVARGDLGVEMSPETVPQLQKEIITRCNREGKPVIVATQMLESMILQPLPTRAEASDVYNAVLDGADAVMLSGETSIGKHPVEAVRIMDRIVTEAERTLPRRDPDYFDSEHQTIAEILGHAIYTVAGEFDDQGKIDRLYILTITREGYSARMISKYRPPVPILAATPSRRVGRELRLLWGVEPILFEGSPTDSTDHIIKKAVEKAFQMRYLSKRDYVAVVCASRAVQSMEKKTNLLGLFQVGEIVG